MKIVVLDSLPLDAGDLDWSGLNALGELIPHPSTSPDEVAGRIADADIVLTNKVPVRSNALADASRLRMIGVLATGYDVVDIVAARERGIDVCNVPGYSSAFTAQTAIALILELANRAGEHAASVRKGDWSASPTFSYWKTPLVELDGKTLAIVGLGAIGRRVAAVCSAMGMHVVAAQLTGRASGESAYPRVALDEAFRVADVISLHAPMTPQTKQLVNADRLALMKSGALIVNTARGGLVDEQAVADALRSGRLGGYAADVLSKEPPPMDNPLLSAPNAIITPHIAWASPDARQRLLAQTVTNVTGFLDGAPVNVVNSG